MKTRLILPFVLLVSFLIRVWGIGSVPSGLTPDEGALGYNAYSILKTGRDEYGELMPIIFTSFGDYKPGLYVYADVPFVALFGLNEFAVRLPSVLSGVFIVFMIYKLGIRFSDKRIALFAALVGSINPWLIYFSRGAWEANLSLAITLAAVYFFLQSFEKPKYLILSAFLFSLTLLTYQGAKFSTLIVLAVLGLTFFAEIKKAFFKERRIFSLAFIMGIFVSLPIILSFFRGQTARLEVFSLFSYPRPEKELSLFLSESEINKNSPEYFIFHSETLNFKRAILGRWFNALSPDFLFFKGDYENPIHSAPYQGMFLLADIILIPLGMFFALRSGRNKFIFFIFLWLLLAPLPAAMSRDRVSAVRSLSLSIPLIYLAAYGASGIFETLKNIKFKYLVLAGALPLYFFSFVYFIDAYFVHLPTHNAATWRYGFREMSLEVDGLKNNYEEIVVEQSFNQPYIYYLFYTSFDPASYQKNAKLTASEYKLDVGYVESAGKIKYQKIDWQVLKGKPGILVAAKPESLPPDFTKDARVLKDIKYPDGKSSAFYILEII
jgi:4-amino-4-deoxy-L-arabinose transferase-like glycosyltransferase